VIGRGCITREPTVIPGLTVPPLIAAALIFVAFVLVFPEAVWILDDDLEEDEVEEGDICDGLTEVMSVRDDELTVGGCRLLRHEDVSDPLQY